MYFREDVEREGGVEMEVRDGSKRGWKKVGEG